jgi:hypothetical protein
MCLGVCPLIQLECQKVVLSPLPTVITVDAWNSSLSVLSQGTTRPVHGRSTNFYRNHSQRNLKARAKRSKSKMPRPPRSLGAQVVVQFTKQ